MRGPLNLRTGEGRRGREGEGERGGRGRGGEEGGEGGREGGRGRGSTKFHARGGGETQGHSPKLLIMNFVNWRSLSGH